MTAPLTAGIVLFDDVDLLDVIGPYEVLLTASRLAARNGQPEPFRVRTLGRRGDPVRAYGGVRVTPDGRLDDRPGDDVIIVPGAIAINDVVADADLLRAIREAAAIAQVVASVCTGAFVLGALGLLDGRRWTTHWEDIDELAQRLDAPGERGVRWVDEGEIVTSGALSSGMAMALHLVDRFAGRELADRTARQIEYAWSPQPEISGG